MKNKQNKPLMMTREDGSRKYAFVTFLMMNDHFLPGILMQGNQLRQGNYNADLVSLGNRKYFRRGEGTYC